MFYTLQDPTDNHKIPFSALDGMRQDAMLAIKRPVISRLEATAKEGALGVESTVRDAIIYLLDFPGCSGRIQIHDKLGRLAEDIPKFERDAIMKNVIAAIEGTVNSALGLSK